MRLCGTLGRFLALFFLAGCGSKQAPQITLDGGFVPSGSWPTPNEWSWDGSWTPPASDFPLAGLLDDEYFDGHLGRDGQPTPVLPPGEWDWNNADNDLANWRNFSSNLGDFERLVDGSGRHYGWALKPKTPANVDYAGPAAYFEGSSGTDLLDLGDQSTLHSFGQGNLADGPDVLVFGKSFALDFRTGSSLSGSLRDNDLVVAGCGSNSDGSFDILTTTIHTGPGSDWAFFRDLSRTAIDLGNGGGGRTDTLDPADGPDLAVLRGNTHDFRVFGGVGNDVVVWYVDDNVQTTTWLGPNFFGGGGWGDALWGDPGTDRLVLVIPTSTRLVTTGETPEGGLLVKSAEGRYRSDTPTEQDPFARYCIECGIGPGGRQTMILEYRSTGGRVKTGYFYVTAFEELQIGIGEGARVYRLDDVLGVAAEAPELAAFDPPPWPVQYCD